MPNKRSKINKIFSSSDVKHGLSLFIDREIRAIESLIIERDGKFHIKCHIKDRYKVAKPEEIVRQLWIYRLLNEYNYPKERIDVERVVYFGSRDSGLADVVVLQGDLNHPYIIFEVKRPQRTAGLEQLKSYCNAEGAPIGVWSNGNEMIRLHREEPNIFIEIPIIPKITETLRDILTERWTLKWLDEHDELKQGKTTLKKILIDLEELVLGNAGVEPFEVLYSWAVSNQDKFWKKQKTTNDRLFEPHNGWAGRWEEDDYIGFNKQIAEKILSDEGFDAKAMIKLWKDKNWLRYNKGNNTYQVIINGIPDRCYCIKQSVIEKELKLSPDECSDEDNRF